MNVRDYFLFGNPNTNITTDSNLTPDMKEYYDKKSYQAHRSAANSRPVCTEETNSEEWR